ncbi:glycine oxidase ThiO [Paenibacillus allorhizosphaerae]|uniref:glycine oxidase n=1 Tax=Paenibacillus allorhizosphaerae TaxID=2849866 RepID=A0ABN7TZS7_9BACL|nr:glycine oxidase ThiO [Paenibacillus allorhizosphaerae]CAG7657320.1 Glycine oxidase [Paenibacillus allorhizosphaerae]
MTIQKNQTTAAGAQPSALIIGGGVIGCAAAYELGKAGFRCTVLDKGGLAQEASTAAAGMLGAQVETHQPGPFYEMCRASQRMYTEWTDELEQASGISVQYRAEGILRAALTAEDEQELRSRLAWIREAEWLEPSEMLRLESELSPDIHGGLHLPADHQVQPVWLAEALKAALVNQGCRIREWTPAIRLLSEPGTGRVTGVQTSEGPLYADLTVLAAGAWTPALTEPIGLSLPMFPVKGQCISVRTDAPLIRSTVFTKGCYIVPKLDGSYIIGASQLEAGFDKRIHVQTIAELHAKAVELLPRMAEAEFVRTWAGLRPGTRDALPFLGVWDEAPGLVFATGQYRNGILLAPVTGRIVKQLALSEQPFLDLAPYAPSRVLKAATATI